MRAFQASEALCDAGKIYFTFGIALVCLNAISRLSGSIGKGPAGKEKESETGQRMKLWLFSRNMEMCKSIIA